MKRNNKLFFAIFALVLLVAGFLRFFSLAKTPPSLFGDEVDVGYQAYSILKTGRDYSGNFFPVHFQSLADWRTPLFLYSTVPFVWLFGLTEIGVRFAPAIFGFFGVIAFYLLINEIFKDRWLALLSASVMAISPWHLQYSRSAFEVTEMIFLILLGILFFIKGLKNGRLLVVSGIAFALTLYVYNTTKLFTPILLVLLGACFWRELARVNKKYLLIAFLSMVVISLPMARDIFFGEGANRFSILSIFTDPTIPPEIGFNRLADMGKKLGEVPVGTAPSISSKIFHNKFLSWGTAILINYLDVFSTSFLFTAGDINYRHSIQGGFGEMFWPDAIFLIFGLYSLAKIKDRRISTFLIAWFLLAPVPSVLTRDGGSHATRLILILPPLLFFVSYGMFLLVKAVKAKYKKFIFILPVAYLLVITLYLHRYYIHWPLESERWWHPGFKEAAAYVRENESKYDYIIWSDRDEPPLIFFLFWMRLDPNILHKSTFQAEDLSDAVYAKHLTGTKYYFGHISEERITSGGFAGTLKPNMLYIAPEGEIGKDLRRVGLPSVKLLEIIYFPSREPAKYILTGV